MKSQIKVIWHEKSNLLATFEIKDSGLPLLAVVDDEYVGINPFYAYNLSWLISYYGWIVVGEL